MNGCSHDVLVVGGGNAALCAALAARERGARVLVIECSPKDERGGNSRHVRNLRCRHDAPTAVLTDAYSADEYMTDLLRVTGGRTDPELARVVIEGTTGSVEWLRQLGVRFQPSLGGTLNLGRTNAFYLGGGKALLNSLYERAERAGVEIRYEVEATGLALDGARVRHVRARARDGEETLTANAVVIASGGFESNLGWLREAWGPAADNFIIRGTQYNTGTMLKALIEAGAVAIGDPKQCHAVAIDARAPRFDGGIVTRLDCVPLGVVVNALGRRFHDEGEDFWPKRYAIWGRLVAEQPEQRAVVIIDRKILGRFMPPVFPAISAQSIAELAPRCGLPADVLMRTVEDYNAAVRPGTFDTSRFDDCRTEGLSPPKTHWAQRLDTPPFLAYPLRPGITFTYLGVRIDSQARIQLADRGPAENLYAAGEIMAGNVLGQGYAAGIGMAIGTVFGRIAGAEAARHAR